MAQIAESSLTTDWPFSNANTRQTSFSRRLRKQFTSDLNIKYETACLWNILCQSLAITNKLNILFWLFKLKYLIYQLRVHSWASFRSYQPRFFAWFVPLCLKSFTILCFYLYHKYQSLFHRQCDQLYWLHQINYWCSVQIKLTVVAINLLFIDLRWARDTISRKFPSFLSENAIISRKMFSFFRFIFLHLKVGYNSHTRRYPSKYSESKLRT